MDDDTFFEDYIDEMMAALDLIERKDAFLAIDLLCNAYSNGKAVFIVSDGISAGAASHLADELGIQCKKLPAGGFRVANLSDGLTFSDALDESQKENFFSEKLGEKLREKDVVFCISATGGSAKVNRAAKFAKSKSASVISLTGCDGGRVHTLADVKIHLPSNDVDVVATAFEAVVHYLGRHVRERFKR
jgi:D-sedoheptulose 7-phosphate isomerase